MKNKLSAAGICCLAILLSLFTGVISVRAESSAVGEGETLIDGIVAYKEAAAGASSVQEWLDGELTSGAGATSEWYVIALLQSGAEYDYTSYIAALRSYASENGRASSVSGQRLALALVGCGCADDPFVTAVMNDSIGAQGVMSWIFGLHLLNNGCASDKYAASDVAETLLSLRLADGGWALTGSVSDVDVTAMAIASLAPYYRSESEVKAAVDGALGFLSEKQLAGGGYSGFGAENPESAAQVIAALSSLGIDPLADGRFIKEGSTLLDAVRKFRLADGAFCHAEGGAYNDAATSQVFYSLIAMRRAANGLGPLFVFDVGDDGTAPEKPGATEPPETEKPTSEATSDPEALSPGPDEGHSAGGYKLWACLTVCGGAAVACALLWICKKRHIKNYLFVLAAAGAAVCLVLLTNIQSADDYYRDDGTPAGRAGSVTLTIRCDTVLGRSDAEYIPPDGVILPVTGFDIAAGDSVYDLLVRAAKKYGIQMEKEGSPSGSLVYISGINYLYEFDFGDLSGWIYRVNGEAQSVGCGERALEDGDAVEWLYTCEMGNDLK